MDNRNQSAATGFKNAESAATRANLERAEDALDDARASEDDASGFYSADTTNPGRKGFFAGGFKGFMKKRAPIVTIFGLIGIVGGALIGMQTLMPVAISEMLIQKFNSVGISSTMASDAWLDVQLNQGVQLESASGASANLFGFSNYQVEQFKAHKLQVLELGSGPKITAILFQDGDAIIPVVGSDMISYGANITELVKSATGYNNVGAPISAKDALNNRNFKIPYTAASKAWRGGASGWFDEIMDDITETKLSINRNRWVRFAAGAVSSAEDAFKKLAASVAKSKTKDAGVDATERVPQKCGGEGQPRCSFLQALFSKIKNSVTAYWGGGEQISGIAEKSSDDYQGALSDPYDDSERRQALSSDSVSASDEAVINATLSSKALKAASAVASAGNTMCSIAEGVMSIYSVISAYQSLEFLNLVSGYLEAVDRVKSGDGDTSPIHEYNTNLTTVGETTNAEGAVVKKTTAMESEGMAWLFGLNNKINPLDQSVQNVNFETIMSNTSKLFKNIKLSAAVYETCGYVKAGGALVSAATTIFSFIPVAGQAIQVTKIAVQVAERAVLSFAVTAAISAIIPVATKNLAQLLMKNAATEWFGEDLGNALMSGANKYLGGNGSSGGQGPGSSAKVAAYLDARETVIADEAEYERATKSPFDISSPYTFLGSLAYSILPLAYSNSGLIKTVTNVSSLTSSSLVAILPSASAISKESVLNSTGDCDLLGNVGAVGDAFCNAYIITDTSTINTSPLAIMETVHHLGTDNEIASIYDDVVYSSSNFDASGNIKPGSNLAKYIVYCGQRTAQYGIKDSSVAARLFSDTPTRQLINYVPVFGDAAAVIDGLKEQANLDWITGRACVASESNEHWDSEYRYYQRYSENERLLENMNPGYTSPVTKFAVNFNEENPLDTSFEGTIARFSGMTVDEVDDTLAFMEYLEFLNNYDPNLRYAFGSELAINSIQKPTFSSQHLETTIYIIYSMPIFDVLRNRRITITA